QGGQPPDPLSQSAVRRGPPSGPWRPLPSPFLTGTTALPTARGRARMVGHASKETPLAPIQVELPGGTAAVGVTPTAKGVPARIQPVPAVMQAAPTIRITNYTAG